MRYRVYLAREFIRETITDMCFWLLRKANGRKSRCLAERLKTMSVEYEP